MYEHIITSDFIGIALEYMDGFDSHFITHSQEYPTEYKIDPVW